MATIVNNPGGSSGDGDGGMGMVLGVVIGILLVLFLIVYGVPILRQTLRPEPEQPGIEINLPSPTPGDSGSSAR